MSYREKRGNARFEHLIKVVSWSVVLVTETAWDGITFQGKLQGFSLKVIFVARRVAVTVDGFGVHVIVAQAIHGCSQVVGNERPSDRS